MRIKSTFKVRKYLYSVEIEVACYLQGLPWAVEGESAEESWGRDRRRRDDGTTGLELTTLWPDAAPKGQVVHWCIPQKGTGVCNTRPQQRTQRGGAVSIVMLHVSGLSHSLSELLGLFALGHFFPFKEKTTIPIRKYLRQSPERLRC